MAQMFDDATRLTTVTRVDLVTPRVRRITFAGEDLVGYELHAPDQFSYLMLPPPGRHELTVDRDFTWIGFYEMPEDDRPVGANYTVRAARPDRGEIDIDLVLHHDAGPASSWAERAQPGDPVAFWGARSTYDPPDDADGYLLVADETGLPALMGILGRLARSFSGPVRVVIEVANPDEHQTLPSLADMSVRWCHRGDEPAGRTSLLFDAVREMGPPGDRPYVWGGGESRAMTQIRRYVRGELGHPRDRVSLTGYWRHSLHADDPDDEEEDGSDT